MPAMLMILPVNVQLNLPDTITEYGAEIIGIYYSYKKKAILML